MFHVVNSNISFMVVTFFARDVVERRDVNPGIETAEIPAKNDRQVNKPKSKQTVIVNKTAISCGFLSLFS